MNEENFVQLCKSLAAIDLFGSRPPQPPWLQPGGSIRNLQSAIEAGRTNLPMVFDEAFASPLENQFNRLARITSADAALIETLGGAVYQHSSGYALAPQLNRFLAVISDLYRSFLDRDKRKAGNLPLRETLPPLAAFKYLGDDGPFTIPVDAVAQLIGGSLGVVSLPAVYADHPLLWASLAHETGGHDVVHADDGLLRELQQGLDKTLADVSVENLDTDTLVALWAYWMDEAVADVYGLLNVGPAFGPNLAAFFAALRSTPQAGSFPIPKVSMRSQSPPGQPLDVHPTDILRIHLAIGVIETFASLETSKRDAYVADLKQLATLCASSDAVQLSGEVAVDAANAMRLELTAPLADMQEAARQVGKFIATIQLDSLGKHSVQEIETWDDSDEAHAEAVRTALAATHPIDTLGDDAQLLAGATMHVLDAPGDYGAVAVALGTALDRSFATDPFWGPPAVEAIFAIQSPAAVEMAPRSGKRAPVKRVRP